MTVEDLLIRLDGVRHRGNGWLAKCPAHPDKNPSLSIHTGERGVLVKCWAGCSTEKICAALAISVAELFFDAGLPRSQRPVPRPPKLDRVALAWRYELAALDRRLRAERIVEAGKHVTVAVLTDEELDWAFVHVVQAYADLERAELFEGVADTLRARDFIERKSRAGQERVA